MRREVVKVFEVEEATISGGWYQIVVRDKSGQQIDLLQTKTQREAHEELERRGYRNRSERV